MEFDGLYFLSKDYYNWYTGSQAEFLVAIAAHETCHQWWYAMVGNDQALEPWLDEALCTYCERLYFEHLYPEGLDWWWTWRVDYYEPRGAIDITVYDVPPEYGSYRDYRDVVYLQGARFLEDLRAQIGDEAFFAFLQDYLRRNTGRIAAASDFFSCLEEHTQAELSDLLRQYMSNRTP
jgi:aminopeptidase N